MTNAEKYREEIEKYDGIDFCGDFIKPKIIGENCVRARRPVNMSCSKCRMLQMLWLMDEYKEPEVDWSKVAVDTPILVRAYKNDRWFKRHFAKYEDGKVYAWNSGNTSWTGEEMVDWEYAKLLEEGDE